LIVFFISLNPLRWTFILNNSKSESLEKSFLNEQVDESMIQLIGNILKKIKKLDGNNICADCSAPGTLKTFIFQSF
jgi:hypothetical protein